jgi:predicted alpha/beta superfamily hydrolase
MTFHFNYFIILFSFLISQANAQNPELYNHISNEVFSIPSRVLNQERKLYIHVPKRDSSDLNKPLPVLYLLDGENHFHTLAAYIDYLSHWKVIPPMIVVGIISIDRRKDLTPTNSLINFDGNVDSSYKTSGGNEQFLQFIQKELMPYIDANYKASPFKIFAGHSLGGLTTIDCMLTHPDMFDAYIAISPSLWWDNKCILRLTDKKLANLSIANKKIFYSDGNEGGSFHSDLLKFDKLIEDGRLQGFEHKYTYYPNESHMTEPIPAYYDGLRFICKDWKYDMAK